MESIIFYGDAFSEYYLTHLLWEEQHLQPLLGLQTQKASYRRAAAEILRAQRSLRARQMSRSTGTLLLAPLADILGWTLGDTESIETAEGREDAGLPLMVAGRPLARIVAISPDAPLDLPPTGIHRRFAPSLSIVRVLEEQDLTWGILLNAFELRLIRRSEGFVSSGIGFDLTTIAEGTQAGLETWKLLWALLRNDGLAAEPPVLERVMAIGREHQEGVGRRLGIQVKEAVVAFMQGIVSHPTNAARIPDPIPADWMNELYAESLRVLYRILFALYGEARGLLPLDTPTYRDGYAVMRLARRATASDTDPRRRPTVSGRFFENSLRSIFTLLRHGADLGPEGKIPRYGGALFDQKQTALVEQFDWGDDTVAGVLDKLTRVATPNRGLVTISYRELDVEQLGAVYESLLEQMPQIATELLYWVQMDGRELYVTAAERTHLAHRRGETSETLSPEEEIESDGEDTEEADDDSKEPEREGEDETRPSTRRPLRILAEIPPGTIYLKAGMGRKQTGSFYTSRALVEFLVREAIDPLAQNKTPEEILALKIVDPAMGSGHFLVGACRRLAEHLLAAYRRQYGEVRAAQPELAPGDDFIAAGIHPEVARNWDYEDRALTACRLLVAGNCLYGVDKNPLAVDLARVSLWLATAAADHPLTFLDHRLRTGDSLLGLPIYLGGGEEPELHLLQPERTAAPGARKRQKRRDEAMPLLAGVPMMDIVSGSTRQLRERLRRALKDLEQIAQCENDAPGDFTGQRSAFDAMQGEMLPFWDLHALRIGQPFLPAQTVAQMDVVNRWLADIALLHHPGEETRNLAADMLAKGHEIGAFCWPLAFPEVYFDATGALRSDGGFDAVIGNPPWDKIKPNERECFSEFDPTVWDVQGQERKRLIAALCRDNPAAQAAWDHHQSEIKTLAGVLLEGGLYHHQIAVVEGKKTGGDPDSFKFFLERAYQLLREGGRVGIIVPLGIQGSLGTTGLRRLLLDHCRLATIVKLDNERYIFPGVFHGQKFDLLVFAKGGRTTNLNAAFLSWEKAEAVLKLRTNPRFLRIDAELYRELSPEQYTFVELHDQREVELLRRIYRQFPRLGEKREDTWNVSFVREFDMTNDSFLFRDAARLRVMGATLHSRLPSPTETAQDASFEIAEGGEYWTTPEEDWYAGQPERFTPIERWVDSRGRPHLPGEIPEDRVAYRLRGHAPAGEENDPNALPVVAGEKYVPLYEGRMVHQFDHCQKAYVSGSGRRARWRELGWDEKRIVPHYFFSRKDFNTLRRDQAVFRPGFLEITGQSNERSVLCAMIPPEATCGHKVPTVSTSGDIRTKLLWTSMANTFVVDWMIRLRVSNSISYFIWNSTAFPRIDVDSEDGSVLVRLCTYLSCSTPEYSVLYDQMSEYYPPYFKATYAAENAFLDIRKRAQLRAEIDARVARLYGLSAHEYARILSTFPLLDQDQPRLPGDVFIRMTNKGEKIEPRGFITRDLALLTYFNLIGEDPPADIVAFFAEAGVNVERQTGPLRDLRVRVAEATQRGAVAYIPSTGKGWTPGETLFLPPSLPLPLSEGWYKNLEEWIVSDPAINSGDPTLKGTRISVRLIHELLQKGWTFSQIIESYPHLGIPQIATAYRWGQLS